METGRILFPAATKFLGHVGFGQLPLEPGIWAAVVVSHVFFGVSALLGDLLSRGRL